MLPFLELKTTYDKINRAINLNNEPRNELIVLSDYFKALASNDGAIFKTIFPEEPPLENQPTEPYLTAGHIRYLFEDLAPGIVKKMARERSTNDLYLDACKDVLSSLLLLSIPVMKQKLWNVEFLLAIRQIMDYDCSLHKLHFQIKEEEIQRLFTKGPN